TIMAAPVEEFTLESVRDFMISRGGRVTNHELVKHFKVFLTDPTSKEIARNKFKQYVNTLANITQEGGEKFLLLKRKFRVGTHLSESEILSPTHSPFASQSSTPGSVGSYGSPQHLGPFSPGSITPTHSPTTAPTVPPLYRAPPPYRPPPTVNSSFQGPDDSSYNNNKARYDAPPPPLPNRDPRNNPAAWLRQGGGAFLPKAEPPVYPAPPQDQYGRRGSGFEEQQPPYSSTVGSGGNTPNYPSRGYDEAPVFPKGGNNRGYDEAPSFPPGGTGRNYDDSAVSYSGRGYDEPADLGIPPAPQMMRSASSVSSLNTSVSGLPIYPPIIDSSASSGYDSNYNPISAPAITPLSASRPKSLSLSSSNSEMFDSGMTHEDVSMSTPHSADTYDSTGSTPSSDEPPPPVPPRRRLSDKENERPSPLGEENNESPGSGTPVSDGLANSRENLASKEQDEDERKASVSVKDVTQRFNRMASESQLATPNGRNGNKSNRNSRADRDDDDAASIHSYGLDGQDWRVAAAKSDFNEMLRLLKIHPTIARYKVSPTRHTKLYWGKSQGRISLNTTRSGSEPGEAAAKSRVGYSPLHIAAMYNRTEVFNLLVHYGADLNMRDYSGKKPRQYNTTVNTVSNDTQKRIIQRRNSGTW
ncbi:unnamed protein product, partial [Meganyctiphanes norvegica]